jgi:hypothetical protein
VTDESPRLHVDACVDLLVYSLLRELRGDGVKRDFVGGGGHTSISEFVALEKLNDRRGAFGAEVVMHRVSPNAHHAVVVLDLLAAVVAVVDVHVGIVLRRRCCRD